MTWWKTAVKSLASGFCLPGTSFSYPESKKNLILRLCQHNPALHLRFLQHLASATIVFLCSYSSVPAALSNLSAEWNECMKENVRPAVPIFSFDHMSHENRELVFQNNEMAAMLVYQTNPMGVLDIPLGANPWMY